MVELQFLDESSSRDGCSVLDELIVKEKIFYQKRVFVEDESKVVYKGRFSLLPIKK